MNRDLTVLIPTSPIPSHPSTAILDETIANIRKYTDARIIIMVDGVHESLKHREEDYKEYYVKVIDNEKAGKYGDCKVVIFPEHNHQSSMTRFVLNSFVTTPLIMFCEHDTSPIGEIPFEALCGFIKNNDLINCVRFNIFERIPKEHEYLMIGEISEHLPITRTIQWSQRPHIAKTEWYIDILDTYFLGKTCMIEDVMHSVVQVSYDQLKKDVFGLAIYTPEGNQLRSYHADGRGHDEKIIGV
jgi:hypothetical protein